MITKLFTLRGFPDTRSITIPAILAVLLRLGGTGHAASTIFSPDGQVATTVSVSGNNLTYSVGYRGVPVIEPSTLGVVWNGVNVGVGAAITGATDYATNGTFVSRNGIHARGMNNFVGQAIGLSQAAAGVAYVLNVRVYNNGVAFRYEFGAGSNNLTADASGFVIPAGSTAWADTNANNYERYYVGNDIAAWPANTVMGPPVTIQLAGTNGYLALTESDLAEAGTFPNPYLVKSSAGTGRELQVAYPLNGDGTTGAPVSGPAKTPWNVIMLGADLNALVTNDIVESVAPAPDITLYPQGPATRWCASGRSVWDWLRHPASGITYTNAMTNSFWASQMGLEYNTVDDGWINWNGGNPWPQVQMVASYSHSVGVKALFWIASSGLATQPQRAAFFQQLRANGADGFKADFFDFNSVSAAARERTQLQMDILREAATYQLVADFHGCAKPAGQFRTFPNLINMEAVFGKEQWPNPWMIVSLPFTRLLAGPADFTPMEFGGNAAFEIANVINMPGPLITFAEESDTIAKNAFASLIRAIPCQWDETVVLPQSKLGQTTATARRKGQEWFVAIMNATATNQWNLPLTFLASNTTYQADIIRQDSTALEHTNVTRGSWLSVTITSTNGSGFVARIYPPQSFALATNYLLNGTIIGTSGSWGGAGNGKEKVFDGSLTTYFDGPDSDGDWAGLDLGAGNQKIVSMIRYCPQSNWSGRMVSGAFQAANAADFSDAVALTTVGFAPANDVLTAVTLTNRTPYRYVRYLSPPGGWGNVAEVQFYGATNLPAPDGLTAAAGANQVILGWTYATNTVYRIARATNSGGPYFAIATNLAVAAFTNLNLINGQTYWYVVAAIDPAGLVSANSPERSATPLGVPDPPTGVIAVAGMNQSVAVTWNAGFNTVSYRVGRSVTSGGPYLNVGALTTTSFADAGLTNGTTYCYVVTAVNGQGESENSVEVETEPGSYAAWLQAAQPSGWWRLNETSGVVAHDLIGGNDGLYVSGYTLGIDGPTGDGFETPHFAAQFDGFTGYVQIARLIGDTNFTIAFWMQTTASGGGAQWYNGLGLVDGEVDGNTGDFGTALVNGKFALGIGNPDTTLISSKSVNDGMWHYVAATRNAANGAMAVYIDGIMDNNRVGPTGSRTAPPGLKIGSIQTGVSGGFFNGQLCEVTLFNELLAPSQIALLFRASLGLFYDPVVGGSWNGTNLILTWRGGGRLLEATNLAGPWITNMEAASPFLVKPDADSKFFRLSI